MRRPLLTFAVHDRPGKGIYRCVEFPQWVVTLRPQETLPPCYDNPLYSNVRYQRVVDLSTAIGVGRRRIRRLQWSSDIQPDVSR